MGDIITKKCSKCGKEKTLDNFGKSCLGSLGLKARCRKCSADVQHEWWEENKERSRESHKKWYQENKEKARDYANRWRNNNKEKANRYMREYRKIFPEIVTQNNNNRRVAYAGLSGKVLATEWKQICDKYGNKCLCCGRTDVKLSLDHVIPLSMGGQHEIGNIQPLCLSCNCKKHTKTVDYRPKVDEII